MSGSLTTSSPEAKTVQFRFASWRVLSVLGASVSWFAIAPLIVGLSQPTVTLASEATGKAAIETLTRPTLKPGSQGAEVSELQATLKLLGFYSGTVDGVYGQSTVSAVSQFQQAAGLSADGITGPATWNRLFPPSAADIPSAAANSNSAPSPTPSPANTSTNPAPTPSASSNTAASFPVPSGINPVLPSNGSSPSGDKPAATPRPATSPAPIRNTTKKPNKPTSDRSAPEIRSTTPSAPGTEAVGLPTLRQGMKGPAVTALQERLRSIGVYKGTADGVFGNATLAAVQAAQRRFKLDADGVVGPATWSALLR